MNCFEWNELVVEQNKKQQAVKLSGQDEELVETISGMRFNITTRTSKDWRTLWRALHWQCSIHAFSQGITDMIYHRKKTLQLVQELCMLWYELKVLVHIYRISQESIVFRVYLLRQSEWARWGIGGNDCGKALGSILYGIAWHGIVCLGLWWHLKPADFAQNET